MVSKLLSDVKTEIELFVKVNYLQQLNCYTLTYLLTRGK